MIKAEKLETDEAPDPQEPYQQNATLYAGSEKNLERQEKKTSICMMMIRMMVILVICFLVIIGLEYITEIEHASLNESKTSSMDPNVNLKTEREKLMEELEKELKKSKEEEASQHQRFIDQLQRSIQESKKITSMPKEEPRAPSQTKSEFSITDEEIHTPYTDRLVTTFSGNVSQPPLIDVSNAEEIDQYTRLFISNFSFAKDLVTNSEKPIALKREYLQLHKAYLIGEYKTEYPICVVAPGRNLVKNNMYLRFFQSIENQNYSNYRLFITDDASTDDTYNIFKKKIQEFPRLRTKTTLIKNSKNIGALGNKFLTVFEHCQEGSIVFDVDADDSLIGRQVMKLMNALYQSSGKWFIYSNFVERRKQWIGQGISGPIKPEILATNSYRATPNTLWVTSALRTYLRDLYVKIPKEYFFESENKFYFETSDRFQMYALVELAGAANIKFIPDILYLYQWSGPNRNRDECYYAEILYYEYLARSQTPLLPLGSLEEEAKITPNFILQPSITEEFKKYQVRYDKCKAEGRK